MVSGKKMGLKGKKTGKVNGASSSSTPVASSHFPSISSDLLMRVKFQDEANRAKIKDLKASATEQLLRLVHEEGLWKLDEVSGNYVVNKNEFLSQFRTPQDLAFEEFIRSILDGGPLRQMPNMDDAVQTRPLQTECSKKSGVVFGPPLSLVSFFMNVERWSNCFSDIVSKAQLLETIWEGSEKRLHKFDGALQLITAEFQFPSPLVDTRACYFLRSCEMLGYNSWVVVDVSLDSIFPNPFAKYIKKPSGCLIEADGRAGYSKVTWIEHVEVDNSMVHYLFKPLITSGHGFGASRWLGTLKSLITMLSSYNYFLTRVEASEQGRKNLLRLADRMSKNYIFGVSASSTIIWKALSSPGCEDILVRARFNTVDLGSPRGVIITIATTILVQAKPSKVSDFLRGADNRHKWDLLSLNCPIKELVSLSTDTNPKGSCVSIITAPPSRPPTFYLQEVRVRPTATYVVYSPIDMHALNSVLQGQDSINFQILPSGFVIMPDRPPIYGEDIGGTLLTISFQIVDDKYAMDLVHLPEKSVASVYRIVTETADMIKASMNS